MKLLSGVLLTLFFSFNSFSQETIAVGQKFPCDIEADCSGEGLMTAMESSLTSVAYSSKAYSLNIKFEEGGLDDALMTKKCARKTIKLAKLVNEEWGKGISLRITEAYDRNAEHSSFSLHYEGRAIDITTSDRDKDKLDRLASLAILAGFSWVYNEGDHVHASVTK